MGPPGHFAIAFAAKPAASKLPLWVLLVASEALDLLCFGFAAIGLEDFGVSRTDLVHGLQVSVPASVPWSHGLFMSVVWSVVAGAIAYLIYHDIRTSSLLGLVVFSHWVLDFITHPGELPLLFNGSPKVGLGLTTSALGVMINIFLEFGLLAGGIAIYWINRKRKLTPVPG